MHEPTFTALLNNVYTRSDLAYKISLLKEFLEFTFFTENKGTVEKEGIERFLAGGHREEDVVFLRTLPISFFQEWRKDIFQDTLNRYSDEAEKLPTLALVVPVEFSETQIKQIGEWARKEVDPTIMLKMRVDPSLSIGCRFVWNDKLHDFSLEHYFHQHNKVLHARLSSLALNDVVKK